MNQSANWQDTEWLVVHCWGFSHLDLTAGAPQFLWGCCDTGRVGKAFQPVCCKAACKGLC